MQHKIELLQQKVANLKTCCVQEGGLPQNYHNKEVAQKQLEVVTLKLPPPKVGVLGTLVQRLEKKEE
jgi:hypothetical protein